jgi:hypothetical protein
MSAMQYGPPHVRALAPKRSVPGRAAKGAGTVLIPQAHIVHLITLSYRGRVLV